jgi:hypothetical protein
VGVQLSSTNHGLQVRNVLLSGIKPPNEEIITLVVNAEASRENAQERVIVTNETRLGSHRRYASVIFRPAARLYTSSECKNLVCKFCFDSAAPND